MRACVDVLGYRGKQRIFNVGSNIGYSVNDIIHLIQEITHKRLNVEFLRGRIQDVSANILDTSLIYEELGWTPKCDLAEGIQRMMKAWNPKTKEFCVE